jgi:hypothetical protein
MNYKFEGRLIHGSVQPIALAATESVFGATAMYSDILRDIQTVFG